MIRLALAVGFLSVFGFVAYALVVLLTNHLNKNKKSNEKIIKENQVNNNLN